MRTRRFATAPSVPIYKDCSKTCLYFTTSGKIKHKGNRVVLKEFFSNTFFTIVIAISATILILIYLKIIHYHVKEGFKRRYMERQIDNLKEHFIICGFGRVGSQIAEEFNHEKVAFIVIDKDPEKIAECKEKGYLHILGDAAVGDEVLKKAKIEKAKGLIIAIGNDADAVFIVLTAKALNEKLFTIARASSMEGASKLEKLGIDRVALPYQIGGYHMANMALRPGVVDFLDIIVDSKHKEMVAEEVEILAHSSLIGNDVGSHFNRSKTDIAVLAVRKKDGSCIINPTSDIILSEGDKLILLGTKEQIERIRREYGC